ncbi:MAG: phage holin family protein [Oscillospiraceae bacterium]|nr:phage holin family protein [Oscillospiraceae bacterium]
MKEGILAGIGVAGGLVASAFGGWDSGLAAMIIFMSVDFFTGLIVAGVFHKSKKSANGLLESAAGWKGFIKKGMCLLFVLIGNQLDVVIGTAFVRNAVIIAFISNEVISIVENAGLMGIPVPAVITKAIDILNKRASDEGGEHK